MKGHMMKDSLLTTHMYWSALHCVVELHLSGLHREKCTKKLLVVCCSFLLLPRTWADWQSDVSWDRCTCWGQDPWKKRGLEGINRIPWIDRDTAWLASTASCAVLVALTCSLIFSTLREAQLRTSPGIPGGLDSSCWLMLIQQRPGGFCWVVLPLLSVC